MARSLAVVLVALGLIVAGFTWATKRSAGDASAVIDRATRDKVLLINEGTEPRTLDPQQATGVLEHHIIMALIEGLFVDDPDDQSKQRPGMADRWEHNADYSVWDFHIRENAKWSNGDPVTADDFVFSYRRMLTAKFAASYADMLFLLKNGREYYEAKITDFNEVGVHAVDPNHLRLELIGPAPYLPSELLHDAWYPVHAATVLRFGKIDDRDTKWTKPENFVGNGPFLLKAWRENDVIECVRNPTYWDAATVKLNGIKFYSIENLETMERAFAAGQLHKTLEVPLDKVPYYRREHPDLIRIDPYEGTYFYRLNVNRKPLDNPKVSLALNLAVDREAITKNILRQKQLPATGYTPPGMGDYQPLDAIHYDPERARQLLAEAGYPNGKNFPKFSILINTSQAHRVIAEAVQQMWKSTLNIDVGIENQEWKVYLDTQVAMNYSISRSAWIADYMDPSTFLNMWVTGDGNNNTGWSNSTYDRLIDQSTHTADPAQRLGILRQAEELFLSQPPVVLLYWYTNGYLLDPGVKNWNPLVLANHNYKFIDLEVPAKREAGGLSMLFGNDRELGLLFGR